MIISILIILECLCINRSSAYTYIDPRIGESGMCSYYEGYLNPGRLKPNGIKTSNGEYFHRWGYTAAHKTLPFGTRIRIRNEVNNRTVEVKINDRGPFYRGRILDMTRRAFIELGPEKQLQIPCVYEILEEPPTIYRYNNDNPEFGDSTPTEENYKRKVRVGSRRPNPIKLTKLSD